MLSRDLDSRPTRREVAAVEEWLDSSKAVHIMRDHPSHKAAIMAGMWGAALALPGARWRWNTTMAALLADSNSRRGVYGTDQAALERHAWSWAKDDSLQHDSYSCKLFNGTTGFPSQRIKEHENFVGSAVSMPSYNQLWSVCPEDCRREGHPEWHHC